MEEYTYDKEYKVDNITFTSTTHGSEYKNQSWMSIDVDINNDIIYYINLHEDCDIIPELKDIINGITTYIVIPHRDHKDVLFKIRKGNKYCLFNSRDIEKNITLNKSQVLALCQIIYKYLRDRKRHNTPKRQKQML